MTGTASVEGLGEKILTLEVFAGSGQIADFKEATFDTSAGVPAAFGFCWIALPEVRGEIAGMIGPGRLPLHESQSFEVIEPLVPDTPYRLDLHFVLIETPRGLEIKSQVSRKDGFVVLYMQTLLRLLLVAKVVE